MSEGRIENGGRLSAGEFVTAMQGPFVIIRVGDKKYNVSMPMICKNSPFFTSLFENHVQDVILVPREGIVSTRSFEGFLQWLYTGKVGFEDETPEQYISDAIELARFADLCGANELSFEMGNYIKKFIDDKDLYADNITSMLRPKHISAGMALPLGHKVMRILAQACVTSYLKDRDKEFFKVVLTYRNFSQCLLTQVKNAMKTMKASEVNGAYYTDPINNDIVRMPHG